MATVEDVLQVALAEIGVKEYPPKSNNVKYNTEYYGEPVYGDDDYPWCMVFVWWVFKHADASDLFMRGNRTASCPALARWAQAAGQWITEGYRIGDVLIFDFDPNDEWPYEHTGILAEVHDGYYVTIEGNTGITSDDNGGAVMRRVRYAWQIKGAYRPHYAPVQPVTTGTDKEDAIMRYNKLSDIPNGWGQRDMIEKLMDAGIIAGDGSDPSGNDDVIDLSEDMIRMLAFNYRGGCYDKKLIAKGLEPAVE